MNIHLTTCLKYSGYPCSCGGDRILAALARRKA